MRKNGGREWQAKGQETTVNVYDYLSIADGKAIPYGIYDLVQNSGFVNVGIDHETAAFAIESIRRWWKSVGSTLYPRSRELLIVADGGGVVRLISSPERSLEKRSLVQPHIKV